MIDSASLLLTEKGLYAKTGKQTGPGGRSALPAPLTSVGYSIAVINPHNRKNRFVKNPQLPPAFGQNKTSKTRKNSAVINKMQATACMQ